MSASPCPEWVTFRKRVGDTLDRIAPHRFVYLDEDWFVHICPVCRARLPEHLVVRFHGRAPRAEIRCSLGCPDDELARALAIEAQP